jgi:protein-tyrosine phosphatase
LKIIRASAAIVSCILFHLYAVPADSIFVNLLSPANGSTSSDTRPTDNPFIAHSAADMSIPLPTQLSWKTAGTGVVKGFTVSVSEDSAFAVRSTFVCNDTVTQLSLWSLKINTPFYWKVAALDTNGFAWTSPVYSFTTPDVWPRMMYIEGTTNVRDIGGRRNADGLMIRQGIFFRSAEFNQTYTITATGISQLRQLGIVCEIDLRNSSENPLALPMPLIRYLRPITDAGGGIIEYRTGLETTPELYRDIFRELARSQNYPVIIHCRLGADRTGTVAAVLEALLGCSQKQMGDDYIWTSLSVNGIRDTASAEWQGVLAFLKSYDKQNSTIQAGAWNFLQTLGITVAELMSIRKIFLGDDRQPFPALGVKAAGKVAVPVRRLAARLYVPGFSRENIFSGADMRRAALYDLYGRRIRTFNRNLPCGEGKLTAPRSGRGVGIISFEE